MLFRSQTPDQSTPRLATQPRAYRSVAPAALRKLLPDRFSEARLFDLSAIVHRLRLSLLLRRCLVEEGLCNWLVT